MFTGGETSRLVRDFFEICGEGCNDSNSPEYIDIIVWNAWVGDWEGGNHQGQTDWTVGVAREMKSAHQGRPVWLTNWGFLGETGTPTKQADAIGKYGILKNLDRVYYFATTDVGGSTPVGSNTFDNDIIRDAFLRHC